MYALEWSVPGRGETVVSPHAQRIHTMYNVRAVRATRTIRTYIRIHVQHGPVGEPADVGAERLTARNFYHGKPVVMPNFPGNFRKGKMPQNALFPKEFPETLVQAKWTYPSACQARRQGCPSRTPMSLGTAG